MIMEEPSNEEWEIEEQYYRSEDDNENESWKMSWLLNKGLGLGKKILFTSFVISSAPLALPPLVVFSAIGIVVSIPSGIFLASYACSEKLMSKLLPIPPEEEEMAEEEEEEYHRGVKRKIEIDENGEEEKKDLVVAVPLEARKEPLTVEEEIVVEISEEKLEPEEIVEVDSQVVQEKENGVEEKKTTEDDNNKKTGQTPQEISTSSKGDDTKTTQTELPVSISPQESKDQPEISSEKPLQTTPSSTVANEAKKKKNVKKKQTSQQPPPPPPPSSQSKIEYDDKKIWEQIEAVRKIVGYKVTAQTTSVEELKALYIFTGVKPPASFKEPSDLAEVNNKLQFLKSIIGVN